MLRLTLFNKIKISWLELSGFDMKKKILFEFLKVLLFFNEKIAYAHVCLDTYIKQQ